MKRQRKKLYKRRLRHRALTETITETETVIPGYPKRPVQKDAVVKFPGRGRRLVDYSQESLILSKIDELHEGNDVFFDLQVDGGTLSINAELGGYLDAFVNIVRNDFSEIEDREERFETAVAKLVEMKMRERRLTQKSLRTKKGKRLRMRRIGDEEFQKNIDEGVYGEQEEIISEIYLIANDPDSYLKYKALKEYDSGEKTIKFVRERGYWMKYGMVISLVSDIRSREGWFGAINTLEELWNEEKELYDDDNDSKRRRVLQDIDDDDDDEEDIIEKMVFKKRRMSAPRQSKDRKIDDLYKYLSLYLEPTHDFIGGIRTETKEDKSTGKIKDMLKDSNFKKNVLKPISDINLKDNLIKVISKFKDSIPAGYGYDGKDELRNLLEIMTFINAKDKCLSLSFQQSKFKPNTDEAYSLGEKIQKGIQSMLKFLIEKFFVGVNRIFRDADGTIFIHSIEKEKKGSIPWGSDLFAEKMLDGAGSRMFTSGEEIDRTLLVDYRNEVYSVASSAISKNNWENYIVEGEPKEHQIQIKPYPLRARNNLKVMDIKEERIFKINLGKGLVVNFDPTVHDLSLFVKYYMKLDSETPKQVYKDMIWVLLSVKRMGDHGQAERALISAGVFESGDHLSAAYGMLIDTPTLFKYTTELTMFKTSSKVSQIIKVIQQSSKNILKLLPRAKIFKTLSDDVSRKYQYDGNLMASDIKNNEMLIDTMTMLSSISKLLGFVFSKNKNTPEKVISDTFGKVKVIYDQYKTKLIGGERILSISKDLAKAALFFFMKKNSISKAMSGFDILVRVLVEIKSVVKKDYFNKYENTITQIIENNISVLTDLPTEDLKKALSVVIDVFNESLSRDEYDNDAFSKMIKSAIRSLEMELESVSERIESLSSILMELL